MKNIFVTRPSLPPLQEFIPYLEQIWSNEILTNGGPYHQQLEERLAEYLGVRYVSLFGNGTLALLVAIKALDISGEVITTPYSFVATSHSLLWNGIKPIFVDIDPETFNLNPDLIERAITSNTSAILPVHCYGNPCDVYAIQGIADKHNLKLVYDGAHAFGCRLGSESILNFGDLAVLSFHATKVFNTFEGGAIICKDAATKSRIDQLKNFGILDEITVSAVGINGKMSEFNAALGLLQLQYVDDEIQKRKVVHDLYLENLEGISGISFLKSPPDVVANYSYFPILVEKEYFLGRDGLYNKLRDFGIFARRYFYPLITDFPIYKTLKSSKSINLPIATRVAQQILCLPIYSKLMASEVRHISDLIRGFGNES
jgi:dTDP-4-amino-4,6-dideoxygalactose transaminase